MCMHRSVQVASAAHARPVVPVGPTAGGPYLGFPIGGLGPLKSTIEKSSVSYDSASVSRRLGRCMMSRSHPSKTPQFNASRGHGPAGAQERRHWFELSGGPRCQGPSEAGEVVSMADSQADGLRVVSPRVHSSFSGEGPKRRPQLSQLSPPDSNLLWLASTSRARDHRGLHRLRQRRAAPAWPAYSLRSRMGPRPAAPCGACGFQTDKTNLESAIKIIDHRSKLIKEEKKLEVDITD